MTEGYENLVYKTLEALRWALTHTSFEVLLKTDDDTVVHIGRLWMWLDHRSRVSAPGVLLALSLPLPPPLALALALTLTLTLTLILTRILTLTLRLALTATTLTLTLTRYRSRACTLGASSRGRRSSAPTSRARTYGTPTGSRATF